MGVLTAGTVQAESPYETTAGTEMTTIGSSAILFALGYWADLDSPNNRPLIPEEIATLDPVQINKFDRPTTRNWSPGAAHLSDIFMYSAMIAPLSLSLTENGSKEPLTVTLMHAETLLLNGGATYLFKNLFRRTRPFVYNTNPQIPDSLRRSRTARRSFPSGHTSTAFASMVFMATVYGQMNPDSDSTKWVWAGCLTTASVTGYLRYAAGYHYPTDILAGAALGAFAGWLVPQMHEIDEDHPASGSDKQEMMFGFTLNF